MKVVRSYNKSGTRTLKYSSLFRPDRTRERCIPDKVAELTLCYLDLKEKRPCVKNAQPLCRPELVPADASALQSEASIDCCRPIHDKLIGTLDCSNTQYYRSMSTLWAKLAARTVLCSNMAIVIGPTPPGTGVIYSAFSFALS